MAVNVLPDFLNLLFILPSNFTAILTGYLSLFERISASKVCNKEISKIKVTLMFDD